MNCFEYSPWEVEWLRGVLFMLSLAVWLYMRVVLDVGGAIQ